MMFQLWSVLNDIKYSRYSKADQKFTGLWHQADKHDFSTFCQSPWLGMLSRNEVMSSLRCYAYFSEFIDRGVLASSKASKVLRFFLDQSSPLQEHEWVGLRGLLGYSRFFCVTLPWFFACPTLCPNWCEKVNFH
jgi:hypothetical protein